MMKQDVVPSGEARSRRGYEAGQAASHCDVPAPAGKATREERAGGKGGRTRTAARTPRYEYEWWCGLTGPAPESRGPAASVVLPAPLHPCLSPTPAMRPRSPPASQTRPYGPRRGTAGRHHPPPRVLSLSPLPRLPNYAPIATPRHATPREPSLARYTLR
ncbi:uncharacterized protein LOC123409775 isoform X2 [Hordeum vulgare subsp. vulgare]|nr:uncharacterized protein LOC123409775 isoform X2 [Hordeum vulgare subsp. vulgare]